MVTGPMQGKLASSEFDLGYSELFCIPEVTSVFFSSCESVLEDSLEINLANRGSLHVCLGKCNCSACNAGESGLISWRGGSLMVFSCCGINVGIFSSYGVDVHSKLEFVQQSQDTCLCTTEASGV